MRILIVAIILAVVVAVAARDSQPAPELIRPTPQMTTLHL